MELLFLLKKTVSFFVQPFGLIITLLTIGLYFHSFSKAKRKHLYSKILLFSSLGFLLLFSYPPFANLLVENLENQYPQYEYKEEIKYIHVLGNGFNSDSNIPLSSKLGSAGKARVLEGIVIHKRVPNSIIIFTSFKRDDNNISSAEVSAQLAVSLGVNLENIIVNSNTKDTYEEAQFLKSMIGNEKFVLVTSASHMPRAVALFKNRGLKPFIAPTDFHKTDNLPLLSKPSLNALMVSQVAIHEYIGKLWTNIKK